MPSRFPARLIEDLWRTRCSTGWAHGSIWTHRRGVELRILWDGQPVWSSTHADLALARQDADAARRRLERDGYAGLASLESTDRPPRRRRQP